MIERRFAMAAAFAAAGAVLTFFGFMHGPAVGLAVTPLVAGAYAIVAGLFVLREPLDWAGLREGRPTPAISATDAQPAE